MKLLCTFILWLLLRGNALAALDLLSADINDTNVGSTTTISLSPTAGCAIFVTWVGWASGAYDVSSVVDNTGASYTILRHSNTGGTNIVPVMAWYQAASAGVTAITINHTNGSSNYIRARAFSWCGQAASMADQTGQGTNTTGTSTTVSTSGPTTNADELVVAVIQVGIVSSDVHLGANATTGYTGVFREQDYVLYVAGGSDYKTISAIETPSATWSHDDVTGAEGTASLIATFKLAGPAAAGLLRRGLIRQ